MGETVNTGKLAMMAGMALTPIGTARAGRGGERSAQTQWRGCRGGWRALMARRRGEGALTGGARVPAEGSGVRIGPPGPEERGGCERARAGLEFGPAEGGERDFLFLFLF